MESIDDILARHGLDDGQSQRNRAPVGTERRTSRRGSADVDVAALLAGAGSDGSPRRRRARPDDDDPLGPADAEPRTGRRRAQPDDDPLGVEPRARRAQAGSGPSRDLDDLLSRRADDAPARRGRHDTGSNRVDSARHDSGEFRARDPFGSSERNGRRARPDPLDGPRAGRPDRDSGEFRSPRDAERARARHDGPAAAEPGPARRARHDSGEFRAGRGRSDREADDPVPGAARRSLPGSGLDRERTSGSNRLPGETGRPRRAATTGNAADRERTSGSNRLPTTGETRRTTRDRERTSGSNRLPTTGETRRTTSDRERTSGSNRLPATGERRRAAPADTGPTRRSSSTSGRNRRALPDGDEATSRRVPADDHPANTAPPHAGQRAGRTPPDESPAAGRRGGRTPVDDQPATTALPVPPRRARRDADASPIASERRGARSGEHLAAERRPRRADLDEPPATEHPATTALPAIPRGRRAIPDEPAATGATTALPAAGRRTHHAGPDDAPAATGRRGARAPADDNPATTALPVGERRARRADPDDLPGADDHPVTTALPAAGRRRESAHDAPATTALPAAGRPRRSRADDLPATTAAAVEPDPAPDTTALPTSAARRSQRSSAEQTTTALRGVTPRRGTPAPSDPADDVPPPEQATTRVRVTDRPETGSRAHRIDETLTRITAAHAGLALAVRDGQEQPEAEVKRRSRAGRLLVLAMSVMVVGATTFGYATKTWLGSSVRPVAALDLGAGAIVDAAAQQGDTNVLVVATDQAAAKDAGKPPGGGTVVVAHVPANGGAITALSIPTDLEINRPPCERFDRKAATYTSETVRAEARTKLATAFDEGGPRCAVRVVQQLTGIAITKFVGVDLGRVGAAVDAVGGVDVCVPRPVVDATLGPIAPEAGGRKLDGNRAGDFVRAANVDDDPPSGQIERQQQVLAAVLDAALGGIGPLEVTRIAALRKALDGAVVTDKAGIDEVQALAMSLHKLDAPGVTFAAVPTAPETNGRGNSVIRDTDAAALFGALRKDTKLPAGADSRAAGKGPSPAEVSVEVINASTRSGLAGKVGDTLKSLGFSVSDVANAKQPTPQTLIRFSPDQAAAAGLLASTVPAAQQVPNPGATGVLQLVLGRTFDDVVRAPVALRADSPKQAAPAAASCS